MTSTDVPAWAIPPKALAEWLELAAQLDEAAGSVPCRESDAEAWWPDKKTVHGQAAQTAVDACCACPAMDACLAYALAADEREGVWGGTPAGRASRDAKCGGVGFRIMDLDELLRNIETARDAAAADAEAFGQRRDALSADDIDTSSDRMVLTMELVASDAVTTALSRLLGETPTRSATD